MIEAQAGASAGAAQRTARAIAEVAAEAGVPGTASAAGQALEDLAWGLRSTSVIGSTA